MTGQPRHDAPATPDHEAVLAQVLQLAGARVEVAPERLARARLAVLEACRATARRRRRVRATAGAILLATAAALAVVAVRTTRPASVTSPPAAAPAGVAVVAVTRGAGARVVAANGGPGGTTLLPGDVIRAGDELVVAAGGGLAIDRGASSWRLDGDTRLRVVSATRLDLLAGAVYVDTEDGASALGIHTTFGIVRDVGTQFEVRLADARLRVRVRSGTIELTRGASRVEAGGGTEISTAGGPVTRRAIPVHGPDWAWTSALAPARPRVGRTVDDVMRALCREQGWTLVYGDADAEAAARTSIVHGSIDELTALEALSVVLETSGLRHDLDEGVLSIRRGADRRR